MCHEISTWGVWHYRACDCQILLIRRGRQKWVFSTVELVVNDADVVDATNVGTFSIAWSQKMQTCDKRKVMMADYLSFQNLLCSVPFISCCAHCLRSTFSLDVDRQLR